MTVRRTTTVRAATAALTVLALVSSAAASGVPAAAAAPTAGLDQRVASLVDAFPADDLPARDALCARLLALGAPGVSAVLARVLPPGHDDSKVRFAANGMAVYAARAGADGDRSLVVGALAAALGRTRDANVATFFLSQLQLIGGRESIGAVQKRLVDEATAAPAAAALVAIGGPEAERALFAALDRAKAGTRVSIVDALGRLRSHTAVRRLLLLADDADPATRQAALAALAAIGDPAAGPVLSRARIDAPYRERSQAVSLYLQYARRLVESGHEAMGLVAARAVIEGYRRPGESQHAAEALALVVSTRKEQALPDLLAAAESPEPTLRGAARALAAAIPGSAATTRWVEAATSARPDVRAEIVVLLGERGDAAALPFLRESLRSEDKAVRLAAVQAVSRLGGDAALPDLLALLRSADADECAALEKALAASPAGTLAGPLLARIDETPLPGKAVLIQVLGEKHVREAAQRIYRLAEDPEPATREAALTALASLAGESDVPRLVAMLDQAGGGDDVVRLREAITAAVLRSPDAERRADGLLELLRRAPPSGKVAILRLLPRVGGARPLQAVAQETASPDPDVQSAAIGALSRWPEYAAAEELLRVASTSTNRDHARSALQAYVRMVARAQAPTYEKVAAFEMALAVPAGDAERKGLFSAIASVREPESLRLLGRCLDKPELQAAAAAALVELASRQEPDERWLSGHEAYSILRHVEASLSDPAARQRAAKVIDERLRQGGFVPLFDGRSLAGWKGRVADSPAHTKLTKEALAKAQAEADARLREHWSVGDAVLSFDGRGESLWSGRDDSDFELLADWRIQNGGDGGIFLRGPSRVWIRDAEANPTGSGGLEGSDKGPSPPLEKADRPPGEWNSFRIVTIGARVTVYLNDRRVIDNAVLENGRGHDEPSHGSGAIGLSAQGSPIAFRNLYLREIPRELAARPLPVADEGFVPLFNGRDLEGWTGNLDGYTAEGGRIVVHPERAGGNLYTAKEYTDFVLRFEFKLTPAANNGIGIRAPLAGDAAYEGMEIQVLEDGSPVYWGLQPYQYHGSVYGVVPARRGALRPVGEWNSEEITVHGRRVNVVVNGTTVVDADLDQAGARGTLDHRDHPGLKRGSGHIGILGHGSSVEFRNLRIRELR